MAAGLDLVIIGVLGLFVVFMAGLGYAAWSTRDVPLAGSTAGHPSI